MRRFPPGMEPVRIATSLPAHVVERLHRQMELTEMARSELIEMALEGLLRDFEQIDDECGRRCTCGADGSPFLRDHLSSCLKCPPKAKAS